MERFGVPDIVIANAGVSAGTLTEISEDLSAFRRIMDTNVFGMAVTVSPFVAPMRAQAGGTLVGIASVAGFRGLPGGAPYSASKSAAITYLESLRVELYGSGVAVVTICPGYIRTPMTAANRLPHALHHRRGRGGPAVRARHRGKRRFAVIPWQMALVSSCFAVCRAGCSNRLFASAPRKARVSPCDGAESETRRRCGTRHAPARGDARIVSSRAEH